MQLKDKKILFITYYFPPLGGIPPRRALRFIRNLHVFGWKPVVLTVANPSKKEAAWDYELLHEVEELSIIVIRTKWKDILWLFDLFRKLKLCRLQSLYSTFCRRFPPDSYIGWYPYAVNEGMKVIRQHGINLIYSNSTPFTAHLIALKLKNRFQNIPWIADFRDPWLDDPLRPKGLFKWQEKLETKQEAKVIANADCIITASKNYAAHLKNKYPNTQEKITTIYNGYDWPNAQNLDEKSQGEILEFVYAGAFYGSQSPISFLKALELLIIKGDISIDKVRFTIVGGHGDDSWKSKFINNPIMKIISIVNFIPNSQIREKLMKASCLLLHQPHERGDLIVLGKTFEYMSTGRPILALVPRKSECLSILEQSGCLFKQADPDSEGKIREAILYVYENWRNKKLKVEPNWEYISQFHGKNLTGHLADVLGSLHRE